MERDWKTFRVEGKSLGDVCSQSPFIRDDKVHGVIDEASSQSISGVRRVIGKTVVDLSGGFRSGTWVRTSRIIKAFTLPYLGPGWWFVKTKKHNYIVKQREGVSLE